MDKEERARIIRESRANLARLNEQAERWRREETDEQRLARLDRRAAEAKPLTYKTLDNAQMEETHSHADGDNITRSWDDWLDARLNVRLHELTEGIGEELGAMLDAEREKSRGELAQEVKRLWSCVFELQATLRSLDRIERAQRRNDEPSALGQIN